MAHVRPATTHDVDGINEIYNHFGEYSNSTFVTALRSNEDARKWFDGHTTLAHTVLVAEDQGAVTG